MPFYYGVDIYYFLLVVPAFLLALGAQIMVKSTYAKMSRERNSRNLTGAQAAELILRHYGINDVSIVPVSGKLTDHYSPNEKVIRLSDDVYSGTSIASVGVACHEAGHAAQHAENYAPIKIRNSLIPFCNIGSSLGIPLAILGYFLGFEPLISVGLLLYAAIALFQVATLPVEFNASRRALKVIDETGLLYGEENDGAKKVLSAAAMTYVASMIVALANLLRLILRFNNNRRN